MRQKVFTAEDFQQLNQPDRIEFIVRKEALLKNLTSSIPFIEGIAIIAVSMFSRLHTLSILSAFGVTNESLLFINSYSLFFNAAIVILFISAIARIAIFYAKKRSLYDFYREFSERLSLYTTRNTTLSEIFQTSRQTSQTKKNVKKQRIKNKKHGN